MTLHLHEGAGNWFVLLTQCLLLLLLSVSGIPYGFGLGLILIGLLSLAGWFAANRRIHVIENTPTSKIASAAQGYAEISGVAQASAGLPLTDPVTSTVCVWYRVQTYVNSVGGWVLDRTATSAAPIELRDETGICEVLPAGAEIRLADPERIRAGSSREYRVQRIAPGDRLYVVGAFETHAAPRQVGRVGAEPKHAMRQPDDGRPFVLSDRPAEQLARTYRRWAKAHARLAFVGLIGAVATILALL
jgi:hypothetical protein